MSQKIKVLMLTSQLGYGGAETSFIRLANFLSQTMEVRVVLFTQDYGKGSYATGHEALHAEVEVLDDVKPRSKLQRWWRRAVRLRQLKAAHDITISFLSGPNLLNVLVGDSARTFVSLRGSRRYDLGQKTLQRLFYQLLLDPIVFWRARRIIAVSSGLRNEVRATGGKSCLHKLAIIPPFIQPEVFAERLNEPVPPLFRALQGQQVMVGAGRLATEKGFHHLIPVFARMALKVPGLKLLLLGDGPKMPELRMQCVRLGLAQDDFSPKVSSVIFAGYQKNVLPFIALGRIYVLASASEGLPNILLEALSAGVPVAATDTPWGARDVLYQNPVPTTNPYPTQEPTMADYGLLLPYIDAPEKYATWERALLKLLQQPPTAVQMQKNKARLEDFALSRIGNLWVKVIQDAVSQRN